MEYDLNHLAWHRGFGYGRGFHRGPWRGYGFPYRRGFYRRGGCCGPVFFLMILVGLVPFALFMLH